jgi:hypothetical protein
MLQSFVSILFAMYVADLKSGNSEILLTAVFIFVAFLVRGDTLKKYDHTVCYCMKMMFVQWHILLGILDDEGTTFLGNIRKC